MELPVVLQLTQAVTAAAAGIVISLVYDGFYILRKQCRGAILPQLLDALFSAVALSVLFLVVQQVGGGTFRLFLLLAAALGAALYFAGPSRGVRFVLEKAADLLRRSVKWALKPLKLLKKPLKKMIQIQRKLFQKAKRWSTIYRVDRGVRKQSGDPAEREDDAVETKTGSYLYKDYRNCHCRIRGGGVDDAAQTGAGGADASDSA